MDIKKVERKIRDACVRIQKAGGKIVTKTFGNKGRSLKEARCCPASAVIPLRKGYEKCPAVFAITKILQVEEWEVFDIAYGVDDSVTQRAVLQIPSPMRRLGQQLGQELKQHGKIKPFQKESR